MSSLIPKATAVAARLARTVGKDVAGTAAGAIRGAPSRLAGNTIPGLPSKVLRSPGIGLGTKAAPHAVPLSTAQKLGAEFLEAAATDGFSQLTGKSVPTSPSHGGVLYTAAKKALVAATGSSEPPKPSFSSAALERLLANSAPATQSLHVHPSLHKSFSDAERTSWQGQIDKAI